MLAPVRRSEATYRTLGGTGPVDSLVAIQMPPPRERGESAAGGHEGSLEFASSAPASRGWGPCVSPAGGKVGEPLLMNDCIDYVGVRCGKSLHPTQVKPRAQTALSTTPYCPRPGLPCASGMICSARRPAVRRPRPRSKAFGLKGQLVSQKPPVHRLPVPNSSPER